MTAATRRGAGRALRLVAWSLGLPSLAAAQTTDPLFASWRWTPGALGSRPAGMGGAFVGLADGLKAAYANPAGLTLIPVSEAQYSSAETWFAAGTGRARFRMAGYFTRTGLEQAEASDFGAGTAPLDRSVTEAGLAFGAEVIPRLRVGASAAWSRLDVDGPRITTDNARVRMSAGVLLLIVGHASRSLPSVRLGVSYQPGFNWSAQAESASAPGESRSIDIRRPTVITGGFAVRATDRWSFTAQGDIVRYREVVEALRRNSGDAATGFTLPDVVEPRIGAELGAPLWCGCGVVKARAGLHYRSAGTLRYQGPDPVAAQAFTGGRWKTVASLGGSFFTEHFANAIRLDLDVIDLFDGPELSFGVVWRF